MYKSGLTWLATMALAAAIAGCSATPTSGGDGTGFGGVDQGSGAGNTPGGGTNGGGNGNGATSGSSGGGSGGGSGGAVGTGGSGSSAGSTSGSSAGSGASSGSKTGSSGSSAGSGSGSTTAAGDGGATGVVRGCGQGTSCTPGSDLPVPASTDGIQIETPDNFTTVQPGQEEFLCFYKNIPTSQAINVGEFQSWMSPNSSHHFILFQGTGGQPDGSLQQCAIGTGTWLYATSVAGQIIKLTFPTGVGLPMPAQQQLVLNIHLVNPGSTPISPKIKINLMFAKNMQYQAAAMVSFNASINVPPASALGPGTQTVGGTCTAPVGSKFFVMTTHTHKHATVTDVNYVSGGQTTNVVHTTDWENPDVGLWQAPNFLTVKAGDSFTYSCSYVNTSSTAVTVGETAAYNEMCMAIGYYFPAGNATCL